MCAWLRQAWDTVAGGSILEARRPLSSEGMCSPDDVSQMSDNHPGYVPAPEDRRMRLTILLHQRLDQIIDQERQPGISPQERKRLAGLHQQIRTDMAAIRYGATEKTVRDLERRYKTRR
ncbi:hypothetical protein J3T91_00465 [Bifidobacterium sp. B4001]|uniref:hypothetical protein n=1 Tax=unclassified Bifidobacterium TaxID=2608897 RepID=UPI00226B7FCE|nr:MULTISPECIES: hypothetical protein [unclassified Bifidobacterium]MCX8671996.1 hypothetical protein [Bifidobacterium sp. B4079]MCX8680430.1 hypothetical protein [Bifidobacterium sp. B4001]